MKILDSHVHLFAQINANVLHNTDNPLNDDKTLERLLESVKEVPYEIEGFVAIEAVVLTGPNYVKDPIETALFEYLSWIRIIRNEQLPLEGRCDKGKEKIKGLVPFVPVNLGPEAVKTCLINFKTKAPEEFELIKGVRYLFQNQPSGACLPSIIKDSLQLIASKGLVFDVGIDMNVGLWQFEEFIELMKSTNKVTYVFNHLTKPGYAISKKFQNLNELLDNEDFQNWSNYIEIMANGTNNKSFMKLSGAFDQLPIECSKTNELAVKFIKPWFEVILNSFGIDRIIFGSDWPVCSLQNSENTYFKWVQVVEILLKELEINEEDKQKIFYTNVKKAYNLN